MADSVYQQTRELLHYLGLRAVAALNRLYAEAHRTGWSRREEQDAAFANAFRAAQRSLVDTPPATPGRLKPTLLGLWFRWTSIDGMVNPFGLDVLANPDLLPYERPFVAEQIRHRCGAERFRAAERQAAHRAHVVLELARDRALDRPVAGVVHPGCDLVGQEGVAALEEFDAAHADVVEVFEDAGLSGAKGREGRPALDKLLKDAQRRRFDVVMVWALDRFGRSVAISRFRAESAAELAAASSRAISPSPVGGAIRPRAGEVRWRSRLTTMWRRPHCAGRPRSNIYPRRCKRRSPSHCLARSWVEGR